jgi:hypothetical protein
MASDKVNREGANQIFGLSEKLFSISGGVMGGAVGGGPGALVGSLALMGASKLARTKGLSLAAKSIDVIADKFMLDPNGVGRFAKPLADAMAKSPGEFVKVVQKLRYSDPDFKKMINDGRQKPSDMDDMVRGRNAEKERRPGSR